jgi:hypothetical protein
MRRPFPLPPLTLAVLLSSLLAVSATAAVKVDVIVLQNGTRVVGDVKSMKKSRLELKTDDMGTLQIEWANVTQVTAPEFFEVEDMGGRLYFGSLGPGARPDEIEVTSDWGSQSLPVREIARIQLVKSGFWERLDGSIDVGAGYTSASELLQLDFDVQVRFRRPKFETSAVADGVLTRQPDVEDTRRSSLTLGYARLFGNGQRIFAQGILEQNQELGYDLRTSVVGGWAKYLARSGRNELIGGAGLALNREIPVEGEKTTNLEAAIGLNYANFAYDFPNTDIQVNTMAYVGLTQWGRFRLEANASMRREIFSDFYLGLKGYESYDSEPATEGTPHNDWGVNLTVGWSF